MNVKAAQACWSLCTSNSRRETYIGAGLLVVLLTPVLLAYYRGGR